MNAPTDNHRERQADGVTDELTREIENGAAWPRRLKIVSQLRSLGTDSAVALLSVLALTDEYMPVRAEAVVGLGDSSGVGATDSLMAIPEDESETVLLRLAPALAAHPSESTVDRLSRMTADSNSHVRSAAQMALLDVESRLAFDAVVEMLDDPRRRFRLCAANYLAECGDPRAVTIFEESMATSKRFRRLVYRGYAREAQETVTARGDADAK